MAKSTGKTCGGHKSKGKFDRAHLINTISIVFAILWFLFAERLNDMFFYADPIAIRVGGVFAIYSVHLLATEWAANKRAENWVNALYLALILLWAAFSRRIIDTCLDVDAKSAMGFIIYIAIRIGGIFALAGMHSVTTWAIRRRAKNVLHAIGRRRIVPRQNRSSSAPHVELTALYTLRVMTFGILAELRHREKKT